MRATHASLTAVAAALLCPLVAALPALAEPAKPLEEVRYLLSVDASGSGTLTISTRYSGKGADEARSKLASLSAEQLSTRRMDARRPLFPYLQPQGAPRVEDDRSANLVSVEERYAVEKAWVGEELALSMPRLLEELTLPPTPESATPLAVRHPAHVHERWEVRTGGLLMATKRHTVEGPASRLAVDMHPEPWGGVIQVEYRSLAEQVEPSERPRHIQVLEKMREHASLRLARLGARPAQPQEEARPSLLVNLLISVVVLVGIGVYLGGVPERLRRWLRRRRARRNTTVPVEPPLQARGPFIVSSIEQAEAQARRERCACGGHLLRGQTQQKRARSDGQMLTLIHLRCLACNAPLVLSFDLRPN